ncbi:MAG: hypothetical protein QG635_2246 [Bacteroidota bacterium]|nr:hypothetical protein [Bacteroidota bacterium]
MNKYIFIAIALMSLILCGCKCSQNLVTPRVIEPVENANVNFIPAMPDMGSFSIKADSRTIVENLEYTAPATDYKKLGAGLNNIELISVNTGETILRGNIDLMKDSSYTFIFYGSSRFRMVVMMDSIWNYSTLVSYTRYIYALSDNSTSSNKVIFTLKNQNVTNESLPLNNGRYTEFDRMSPGSYSLKVSPEDNPDSVITEKSIHLQPGKLYSFILRGYSGGKGFKKTECLVIENDK